MLALEGLARHSYLLSNEWFLTSRARMTGAIYCLIAEVRVVDQPILVGVRTATVIIHVAVVGGTVFDGAVRRRYSPSCRIDGEPVRSKHSGAIYPVFAVVSGLAPRQACPELATSAVWVGGIVALVLGHGAKLVALFVHEEKTVSVSGGMGVG